MIDKLQSTDVHQDLLLTYVRHIFRGDQTHVNSRSAAGLKHSVTNSFVEFDIYVAKFNICFEFQDVHHYSSAWYFQASNDYIQLRDNMKRQMALDNGLSLVIVPCWWDGTLESLVASITFQRPDINWLTSSVPIVLNAPFGFFEKPAVPGVGELMQASFLTDTNLDIDHDWWMGEKYDGIRFCSNHARRGVYSRNGRQLAVLGAFATLLPVVSLDGEIWCGRGSYSTICMLFKGDPALVHWPLLRMISFDSPAQFLHHTTFEERFQFLLANVCPTHPFIIVATRVKCSHNFHVDISLQRILEDGGEGLILRKMASQYEQGRSRNLIKLKASDGDKEGIVIGVGYNGVKLKLGDGINIMVPNVDVKIPTPSVGDIVSFSYESRARTEVPVNPKIFRIRSDISWDNLPRSSGDRIVQNDLIHQPFTTKPIGCRSVKNLKAFLFDYAKRNSLDPLNPNTWYNVPYKEILHFKPVLLKFKGYFNTLEHLFPNLKLDRHSYSRGVRLDARTRRKFFEKYARVNAFDPLDPVGWYAQPIESILATKGVSSVIRHHGNSVATAISELFPDIGLEKTKLGGQWHYGNRRRYFENYARQHGFDPREPASWYSQSKASIMSLPGATAVMSYYRGSIFKALCHLFPDIAFDKHGLRQKSSWHQENNRRQFFEKYAIDHDFDPLVPSHWYQQSLAYMKTAPGIHGVISHHKNSIPRAIMELFPNIAVDRSKFART